MPNNPVQTAALGFSVHTGWAMAVAVCGPLGTPTLLHRERLDIAPGENSVEVFHVAAEMSAGSAQAHVNACRKATVRAARLAITAILRKLTDKARVASVGVVASNAKLPNSLDAILRSHLLIHSAEGDFFRRAILEAGKELDLETIVVRSRDLAEAGTASLSLKAGTLPDRLATIGRDVGRPWGRDEKDAFVAACVALAGQRVRSKVK